MPKYFFLYKKKDQGVQVTTYPKFGNAQARARKSYGKLRFFSAFPKIKFLSDRDEIFLAVAITDSIKEFFFLISSIKGNLGLKWIPKFGNTV
jgi:hypothetical protein